MMYLPIQDEKHFNIQSFLRDKGYETLDGDWYEHIRNWLDWYKGNVKGFHDYKVYNGLEFVTCHRHSLQMAKKVSEDKADLLLNEKVNINIGDDAANEYVNGDAGVLSNNNFWARGNQLIEYAAALGTGAFVEYMNGDDVKIDYIKALNIYPLSWRNGEITECAFASLLNRKNLHGYYVAMHVINGQGLYEVQNHLFNESGAELPLPEDVLPVWETKSTKPPFQIVKLAIANNIDTDNPMGISLYANSVDVLKGIDIVYDSYDNEFVMGRKRIFVDSSMLNVNVNQGTATPIFDPHDAVFYAFNPGKDADEHIKESSMTLRAQDHETALQSRLDLLSEKCGFGKGYYKFEADAVQTATGVISQNSQLYRKIKKDEILLEKALIDMTQMVLFLGGKNPNTDISIEFDDSIIEDTDAISKRALLELQNGVIDGVVYIERVYGYTEEQAIKFIDEVKARSPAPPAQEETIPPEFGGGSG